MVVLATANETKSISAGGEVRGDGRELSGRLSKRHCARQSTIDYAISGLRLI